MFIISRFSFRDDRLKLFSAVWTIVIIAPLIYATGSLAFIGHPWRVELATSFILCVFLTWCLFTNRTDINAPSISPKIVSSIIAPCCALIIWSAISAFWANSILSVAHHTLVWACYLVFFLFSIYVVSDKKLFRISVISLGIVTGIICISSVIEFTSKEIIEYRYARFAEIFAALLPLFFSFILWANRKYLVWSILVTILLWLGILFSLSRGAFLSSIIGLSVFISFRIYHKKTFIEKRRLIFAALGIVFIALLAQIPNLLTTSEQKASTFSRVVIQDEKDPSNSISLNARFLFAGVGLEMFFENYLVGVGADNYGLEFNKYRAVFSANPANKSTANLQEELLPQRAHNEYLQILAELGIVGATIFLLLFWGIAKLGLSEIKRNKFRRANILTHSAVAGMIAFLCSSLFSSFSFRLMQNGLVFFFLLAILLRNHAVEKNREKQNDLLITPRLKLAFVSIALLACSSLTVLSTLKAASQFFVSQAERQENFETAKFYYENAILLDSANGLANYSYGLRLLDERNYQESAAQFQKSVENGLNDSVSYSNLVSLQILANDVQPALATNSHAVEIFPYSIFLRVRYAALLKKLDRKEESDRQFEIAVRYDRKQAETWRLLINNGALTASRESRVNKEILSWEELKPQRAIYSVLTEQQIVYPDEKPKFIF